MAFHESYERPFNEGAAHGVHRECRQKLSKSGRHSLYTSGMKTKRFKIEP